MDNLQRTEYRSAKRSKDRTFDRIWKYYFAQKSPPKLSEKEDEIRERWDFAWKMMAGFYNRSQIIKAITQKYQISERLAYKDYDSALLLFGDPFMNKKTAKREIASEWLIKGIKKAWDNEDLPVYEKLIGRFSKINGLDFDESDPLEELLKNQKPAVIVFNIDPETLKSEADTLIADIKDVEYEDVS